MAEPTKRFPSTFLPNSFWERNPFLLPNLVVAAVSSVTWLVGFLFLNETHPNHAQQSDIGRNFISAILKIISRIKITGITVGYLAVKTDDRQESTSQTPTVASPYEQPDEVELERLGSFAEASTTQEVTTTFTMSKKPYTTQVILQILSISFLAFHKVASDTLIPVFLASPLSKGNEGVLSRSFLYLESGFGMDSASIGQVLLTQAVVAIIAQLLVIPAIIERFGALRTYRWTLFIFPWMYCMTPFVVKLPKALSVVALLVDLWIKVVLVALGYVCSAIL